MPTRFKNLILLLLVPIGVVALFALFSSGAGKADTAGVASAANKPVTAPQGTWSNLPALPTVTLGFGGGQYGDEGSTALKLKRASAVAYSPNGKIYLLGGRHRADGDDISSPWIWEYDPTAGTYTRKTSLIDNDISSPGGGQCSTGCYGTRASGNMASVVLTDSTGVRIYMVGGSDSNSTASNRVRVYDPVADTLSYLTTDVWPASPARIPGGYAVYNNKLYIFGGYDPTYNNVVYSDTWVFDPMAASGSKWSHITSANLSVARSFIAGAEVDGYIYAIGGDVISGIISTTVVPQTVVERMHPGDANPTWLPVASLPTARGDMGVWSYDSGLVYEITGKIVVGGGNFPLPDSNAYIYDPGTNSWSTFAPLLRNRRNVAYTQYNGILYAFGGYNVGTSYDGSNDSMSYDGSTGGGTNTPTPTGTLPTATNTPTRTDTPTATATACLSGALQNTGFETGSFDPWVILGTEPTPIVSNALAHSGTYSALLGTLDGAEPNGDGSFYQTITVPAAGGTLSYWYYPQSTDSVTYDWQDAYITDTSGNVLATIMHTCDSTATWTNMTFDMAPYAGQTVRIEFLVHQDGFGDDTSMYVDDVTLSSSCPSTPTSTPASTNTPVPPTNTAVSTSTSIPATNTSIPATNTSISATNTAVPGTETSTSIPATDTATSVPGTETATPTACSIEFSDVPVGSTFYPYIQCLACMGIINGYPDGTFLPENPVTRGQLSKITANAAGWSEDVTGQTFQDVPASSTFYLYIERMVAHGVINGYACGGPGEPCVGPDNLPYFRPDANATRGQISKVISEAAGYTDPSGAQVYEDVPVGSTFFDYISRLDTHGVINGYPCGGPGEPCGADNLPYFRPFDNASRGQASKLVSLAFFPECTAGKR